MDGGYRIEAQRWLSIAEKLLATGDLSGAKSFAIRGRESDPRLHEFSDQIIAISETLTASELRVNGNNYDYYSILQLARLTQSIDVVATQYRKLALLLNPTRNQLPFAEQAFRLVCEAWLVFSNPSKKGVYDHEMQMGQFGQLGQFGTEVLGFQTEVGQSPGRPIRPVGQWTTPPPNPAVESIPCSSQRFSVASNSGQFPKPVEPTPPPPVQGSGGGERVEEDVPKFWTTCPYCFLIYEYPKMYEDCALRCQNCRRAFQAVAVPSPPVEGKDGYFCCWLYFPLGRRNTGGRSSSGWSPFSALFANPLQGGGKPAKKVVYEDDLFGDVSESSGDDDDDDSDVDWQSEMKEMSGGRRGRGRGSHARNVDRVQGVSNMDGEDRLRMAAEMAASKKGERGNGGKRKAAKDLGKLDLNVMFSNEAEEAMPGVSGGRTGDGGAASEDNIEGIAFFEGLDEFFSNLPILSGVGKAT